MLFKISYIYCQTEKLEYIRLVDSDSKMLSKQPVWQLNFPRSSDFRKVPILLFNARQAEGPLTPLLRVMKSEGFAERQRSKYAFSYLVLSRLFSSLKKAVFYLCKIGDKSSKAKDFYFLLLCYWFFSLNRFVINESNSPFILAFKIKSSILKQKGKLGGYLSSQWMLLPFVIFKAILNELENQDLYE